MLKLPWSKTALVCLLLAAPLASCGGGGDTTPAPGKDIPVVADLSVEEAKSFMDFREFGKDRGENDKDLANGTKDGSDPGDTGVTPRPEDKGTADTAGTLCAEAGGFGCPCIGRDDCNSGFCVPSSSGRDVCTETCVDRCPQEGWECKLFALPGQDPTQLCLEKDTTLCEPCTRNEDCQAVAGSGQNRCIVYGDVEGSFCGLACSEDDDCDEGYECEAGIEKESGKPSEHKQCVLTEGECACSKRAIQRGAITECQRGLCEGSRRCAAGGLTECNAKEPTEDVCDGFDNDCDSEIDEGFEDTDRDDVKDCVDPDDDEDGVEDGEDNCPLTHNPDQADSNQDGVGDACDVSEPDPPVVSGTIPDSPANENNPLVLGTAEAGADVHIYTAKGCPEPPAKKGQADANGAFQVAVSVEDDTLNVFYARTFDGAGNGSPCSQHGVEYEEDSTPPRTPLLVGTSPPTPSRTVPTPSLLGTTDALALVRIYTTADCSGTPVSTGTSGPEGGFKIPVFVGENTSVVLYAAAKDEAGNVSECSAGVEFTHDNIPPQPPQWTGSTPESPDNETTSPEVMGSAEVGVTIHVFTDNACLEQSYETAQAEDGTFKLQIGAKDNDETRFHAEAVDAAGNVSSCSGSLAYVHDDVAPDAPAIEGFDPETPTNVTTEPEVLGTGEASATLEIFTESDCSGELAGQGEVDGNEAFRVKTSAPADSETTFYAQAVDAAGNRSLCGEGRLFVHDQIPPDPPTITETSPQTPSSERSPSVVGVTEPLALVEVYFSADCTGTPVGSSLAGPLGAFDVAMRSEGEVQVQVPSNAETNLYARASDAAGNVSACSAAYAYVHDDEPPVAPTIESSDPPTPTNLTSQPFILGTSNKGTTVLLYVNVDCSDSPLTSQVVDEEGGFRIEALTQDAENKSTVFSAKARDLAGNHSPCSDPFEFLHDDTPPGAPTFAGTVPDSPSNASTEPSVEGRTEGSATVRLYAGPDCAGAPVATTSADTDGAFAITAAVAANSTATFSATASDGLENTSPCSQPISYTHDTIPPGAPTPNGTRPASPGNDPEPALLGAAEPASTVHVFTNGACSGAAVGQGKTGENGRFEIPSTVAANTTTPLYATATDAAGNISPCSTSVAYRHDDMAPAAPALSATDPVSPSATNTRPKVQGSAEPNVPVEIYASTDCSGNPVASGRADAGGVFEIEVPLTPNATNSISAAAVDDAGNRSGCSNALSYRHDDRPPSPPELTGTEPPSPNNQSTTPAVNGKAEAASTLRLYRNADCSGTPEVTTLVGINGTFSVSATVPANAPSVFSATATDDVDNVSACSQPRDYVHDDIPPAKPSIDGSDPASPSSSQQPRVWGAAEGGTRVTIYTSADCSTGELASVAAGDNDAYSLAVPVPRNEANTLYAQAVDAAGNASPCSEGLPYEHDDEAADPPTLQWTVPESPSNASTTPSIQGITEEPGGTIRVYGSDDCSGDPEGEGTANAVGLFAVDVAVEENTENTFYGTVTDDSANTSACSDGITYINDTLPPVFGDHAAHFAVEPVTTTQIEVLFRAATDNFTSRPEIRYHVCYSTEPGICVESFESKAVFDGFAEDDADIDLVIDELEQGKRYYFVVKAEDLAGNMSVDLDERSAKTYGLRGAVSVAVGEGHVCAAMSDGTVRCWGDNGKGQLGIGNTTEQTQPQLVGGIANGVAVAAGGTHTCALRADGVVRCWGLNSDGQLGDGTQNQRNSPRTISDLRSVVQITAGQSHTCAVRADGTAWCWGRNSFGQIGDGSGDATATKPRQVAGLSEVVQIASGVQAEHTCARTADGQVHCWGRDTGWQLGRLQGDPDVPGLVENMPGLARDIAAGGLHSCALLVNGEVHCWGSDLTGELGRGFVLGETKSRRPVRAELGSTAVALAAGSFHQCALLADSTMRCWGSNDDGQVGTSDYDPTNPVDERYPTIVAGLSRGVVIGAGEQNSCASLSDGTLRCWGANGSGQIGDGSHERKPTPEPVQELLAQVAGVFINASADHTCALSARGEARCWGHNDRAQLGDRTTGDQDRAVLVEGFEHVVAVATGDSHSCGLTSDGRVRCWGDNSVAQAGRPASASPLFDPQSVSGVSNAVALAAGSQHTCAVTATGGASCWGENASGQLGTGATGSPSTPVSVANIVDAVDIAAGDAHTCALRGSGGVFCWGSNSSGQLGMIAPAQSGTPLEVPGVTGAVAVAAGDAHSCALLASGAVYCWGKNDSSQLGRATDTPWEPGTVPNLNNARALAAGADHTCALRGDGVAWCWGSNTHGQIGTGEAGDDVTRPARVKGLDNATRITAGSAHTCSIVGFGLASCWGRNDLVQLGIGHDDSPVLLPTRVRSFP